MQTKGEFNTATVYLRLSMLQGGLGRGRWMSRHIHSKINPSFSCGLLNARLCSTPMRWKLLMGVVMGGLVILAYRNSTTTSVALVPQQAVHRNPISCTTLDDMTSMCSYSRSLCYKKGTGFTVLIEDANLDAKTIRSHDHLPDPPFHAPWTLSDFDASGPEFWTKMYWPYRSFVQDPIVLLNKASFTKATINATWLAGNSAIIAFDATNYNTYHWANSVYAAFLARLRLEGVGLGNRDLAETVQRLLEGRGFRTVIALRPRPTDWQQNYADIALGLKDHYTKYLYADDLNDADELCFERAVVPGASLYLGNSIGNSQLFREIAQRLKSVPIRTGWSPKIFVVTWFMRNDKRRIVNAEEALNATKAVIHEYNLQHGANVQLQIVKWDEHSTFYEQASQMGKTRIFISTHGSALNHCIFMDTGGVVIEINAYQFRYPLDDMLVLQQGHHYMRHTVPLHDTKHQGQGFGIDPYPLFGETDCNRAPDCLRARRDADVRVDLAKWRDTFSQALSAVT